MHRIIEAVESTPPSLWQWFAASASVEGLMQAGGLITLAMLFATGRIITLGQHESRILDLKAHHEKEMSILAEGHKLLLSEKEARYRETEEQRDQYREAAEIQKERADKLTDQVSEVGELAKVSAHLITALGEAVKT